MKPKKPSNNKLFQGFLAIIICELLILNELS